ncbi:MAG TPA: FUSC family protein, partial [Gemmatimonadaceae bacterium]|nr:FUSC family protein [Gemmatimonadaceae bacterium]
GGIARSARALGARVRAADGTGSDVPVEPDALPTRLERKMRFAADVLAHRQPWTPPRPADAVIGEAVTAAGGATPLGLNPDEAIPSREALRPTLRLAIQAAIAAALAMVAGHPLSSERWYWAVIGAFVVFLRATNRAESLSRAWQRILGTVGGVALGVVIADAVGADRRAALVLLYLSVFGAFYLAPLSYAWMIVFVTTALALLYDTLGNYSAALLSLRLEETLIGASIGAVVASVVLPAPARLSVDQRAADLLRESSRAVEALTAADASSLSPRARLRLARRVDRAAQRFRQATRPVWEINLPLHVPRFMHSARAAVDLAYAVRHLVARSGAAAREDAPVRAAPASEWLERINGARAKLAAAAGLPAPLAPTPPHAEIS